MTRREAERAVIEAARKAAVEASFIGDTARALLAAVVRLDALPAEPDLDALNDALNARVAEDAEAWYQQQPGADAVALEALAEALLARREALKPKLRYTADDGIVRDTRTGKFLSTYDCADKLNEKEKP